MERTLDGQWIGRYTYGFGKPVPFEARLTQSGTAVEAEVREPNTFARGQGAELAATMQGDLTGATVTLTKRYSFAQSDSPRYTGQLDAARDRITGTWRFPSLPGQSGTFSMVRKPRAAARAARRTAQTADLDT